MERFSVTSFGIDNTGRTCIADALSNIISTLPDEAELFFPSGIYFISHAVGICKKRGLSICGENAVFITHFSPDGDPSRNNDLFFFSDCEDLEINGFTVTTDAPVSYSGSIVSIDPEQHTYDVRLDDEFSITGSEHFASVNTCDADGTPDYVIATYDHLVSETKTDENGSSYVKYKGAEYTVTDEHTVRLKAPGSSAICYGDMPKGFDMSQLYIGQRVYFRCIIYGNSLFIFSNCKKVKLSHIEIERCASMGAVIQPRCSDFEFEEFNIRPPKHSKSICPANADGIHVLGLTGYFHMKNCFFDGLGDDALNIHGKAVEISSFDTANGTVRFICRDIEMNEIDPPPMWAEAGDTISVYERDTFLKKGTFRIRELKGNKAGIFDLHGKAEVGDILANEAFCPSVHVEGCICMHTRARGFLLQSKNMLIENCRIFGTSLPAIIISPDVRVWYEVGPSENVTIRNCVFEKNSTVISGNGFGAVVIKACHDMCSQEYPAGVHKNITIESNTFKDVRASGIFASATDGISITKNRFENCLDKPFEFSNCTNITESDNTVI